MTATRVNAILDIGIALALGVIGGAVAALAMRGCESKACQIVGDCAEPPTVRKSALDTPGDSIPGPTPCCGGVSMVGGCGVGFHVPTDSDFIRRQSGQPPILLEERDSGRGVESPVMPARAEATDEAGTPDRYPPSLDALLESIIAHESVNETVLVGDGGDSRGPAHIQRGYWTDTGRRAKDWYEGVMDREESKRCTVDYFRRYEPEALANGDFETLARLHNGGPNWRQKLAATDGYWAKVNGQ